MDSFIRFAGEDGRTIYVLQHSTGSFAARHHCYIGSSVPRELTTLLYAYD